jgi:hypothetical protein
MPLRDILAIDAPDDSVIGELVSNLTKAPSERNDGTYDVDSVLFYLTLAIFGLTAEVINGHAETLELKASIVSLERRILEAGVPLSEG